MLFLKATRRVADALPIASHRRFFRRDRLMEFDSRDYCGRSRTLFNSANVSRPFSNQLYPANVNVYLRTQTLQDEYRELGI